MAVEIHLDRCYELAVEVAKAAGEVSLLCRNWWELFTHTVGSQVAYEAVQREKCYVTKETSVDLCTETDKAVEAMIIGTLKKQFPSHR